MHLFINYDPLKESGKKIDIGFLIDSGSTQGEYLETVQRAFSASPLSEFFDFYRADDEIQELTKEIIDDFIDHIVISQEKKADGKRQPQIYFKGIGLLS